MNDNHKSLHDESDDALDRAIRRRHGTIVSCGRQEPRYRDSRGLAAASPPRRRRRRNVGIMTLGEEEKEIRSGFEALARSLGPIERLVSRRRRSPIERACRRIQQPFP